MTNHEIVTEESVQKSLDHLRDEAKTLGRLTTELRRCELMTKVVLALVMKTFDGPVSAQDREARTSPEYIEACDSESSAAGKLAECKALREAAAMRIEVWRSQSANYRMMKI